MTVHSAVHSLLKIHLCTHLLTATHNQQCSGLSFSKFFFACHVSATVFLVLTRHIKYKASSGTLYVLFFLPGCFNLFMVGPFLTIRPQHKVTGSERLSLIPKYNHSISCSITTPLLLSALHLSLPESMVSAFPIFYGDRIP